MSVRELYCHFKPWVAERVSCCHGRREGVQGGVGIPGYVLFI